MTRRDRAVVPGRGNHGLEQLVLASLRANKSLLPDGPLVIGLSGGPDSLALLVILSQIRAVVGHDFVALHVDHRLRPESAGEANQARELAVAVGVVFHLVQLEPGLAGRHPGVGVEEAARRERYQAAATVTASVGGTFVTGHHADDQAETVLLHLLRGSGMAGVGGIRTITHMTIPWWHPSPGTPVTELTIVRPLLWTRQNEIADYLKLRRPSLVAVQDPTNGTDQYRRNAIRHHLLPEAERAFPGAVEALNRFSRIATEESDFLDAIAATVLNSATDPDGRLSRSALAAQPVAIARRVLRVWLLTNCSGLELTMERVEALRELAGGGQSGWSVEVGGGHTILGDGDLLAVTIGTPGGTGENR